MIFFVIFTAYEEIYRKASKLLVVFVSLIIFGQYFFSLIYERYLDEPLKMKFFKWLSLVPHGNSIKDPFNNLNDKNLYFRLRPTLQDWIVLFIMAILNDINSMFKKKKQIRKLEEQCNASLKDQYGKALYYYKRVENIVKGLIIYVVLLLMIYVHTTIEINLINWVFFTLNVINAALFIRGTESLKYLR